MGWLKQTMAQLRDSVLGNDAARHQPYQKPGKGVILTPASRSPSPSRCRSQSKSQSRSRSRTPKRDQLSKNILTEKAKEMLSRALPKGMEPFAPTAMGLPMTHAQMVSLSERQLNSGACSSSKAPNKKGASGVIVKGKKKGAKKVVQKVSKKGSSSKGDAKGQTEGGTGKKHFPGVVVKATGICVKPGQPSVRRPLPKFTVNHKVEEDWLWRLISMYRTVKATNCGLLAKSEYEAMCDAVKPIFASEGVLHNIKVPENGTISIIGDLHGHYDDFVTILQAVGMPSATNFWIFNGDVVDRGAKQIQIISTVFLMKIAFPKYVFLTRGNHECRTVNQTTQPRGFKSVVCRSFAADLWHKFLEVFDMLPIVMIVNDLVMVVHGGLPRKAGGKNPIRIQDLAKIRKEDVGDIEAVDASEQTFMLNEMLWNDSSDCKGFQDNSRGPGTFLFGPDVTTEFLKRNRLKLIVRSHDVRDGGYEIEHDGQLVTVFSAPHYCGLDNSAAFLHLPGKLLNRPSWEYEKFTMSEFGDELLFSYEHRGAMEENDCKKLRDLRQRVAFLNELFRKSRSPPRASPSRG